MLLNEIKPVADKIKENVEKVIIGKGEIIDVLLSTIIAGGHVLLEDVPGTGKTVLAKSIAKSIGAGFKRIQFTPDLLPSDLTGINYYNQKQGEFVFRQGPLFTNILLADEINRATPRTQSSLLECMEERQISIDGVTHILNEPFFVIATQNPIETTGTFPLPEAQLDRFLVKVSMGYPTFGEGLMIIDRFIKDNPLEELQVVCSSELLLEARKEYNKVFISNEIREYILKIVQNTLNHNSIKLGVSPRGILALVRVCQAYSAVKGRDFVTPDDVKFMIPFVFSHRIILKDNIKVKGISSKDILQQILEEVPVPTENWKNKNVEP